MGDLHLTFDQLTLLLLTTPPKGKNDTFCKKKEIKGNNHPKIKKCLRNIMSECNNYRKDFWKRFSSTDNQVRKLDTFSGKHIHRKRLKAMGSAGVFSKE